MAMRHPSLSTANLDDPSFEPLVRPFLPRWDLEFLYNPDDLSGSTPPKKSPIIRYPPERLNDAEWVQEDQIQQVMAIHSLAAFVDYMWPVLHAGRPFKRGAHVDVICYMLEQLSYGRIPGNELVISIPPRMLKSVIVNIMYPAWIWLHSPQKTIMGLSGSENVAHRDNRKMRDLISSDRYQRVLATMTELKKAHGRDLTDHWELAKDQNRKDRFENTYKGQRFALASGAKVIGEGMDLQIVDDPTDAKEAMEGSGDMILARMQESVNRYNGVWKTRMQDPGKSARVVIMQRLHEADLAGSMLRRGVVSLVLPMEYDERHEYLCPLDWRTEQGELLLPDHYSEETLAGYRSEDGGLGAYGYAAQFQQNPSPIGGGMFPADRWGYYTEPPSQMARKILEQGGFVVDSWDCASKAGYSNAWSVGITVGFLGGAAYVLDMLREKVELPGLEQMYDGNGVTWGWSLTDRLIEDASNGTALLQMKQAQHPVAVRPQGTGGKETRAGYTQRLQRRGMLLLPAHRAWTEDLKAEHAVFPNGMYADIVDALAQACMYAAEKAASMASPEDLDRKWGWLAQWAAAEETSPGLGLLWS